MQAAVVNVLGQAPKYQSFPNPVAEEGETSIQVRAAGLHPIVKALASGTHYAGGTEVPFVPGVDGGGDAGRWKPTLLYLCAQTVGSNVGADCCATVKVHPSPRGAG